MSRTHLPSRSSELLFEEQAPVTRLAMDADTGRTLWCATTESSVRRWNVPPAEWGGAGGAPPPSPRTARGHGRIFQAGPSPQVRQRQRFTSGARSAIPRACLPLVCAPSMQSCRWVVLLLTAQAKA